jgi:NCAIR mutase (PurE)-related protein
MFSEKRRVDMIILEMNEEEGKILRNVLENYHSHLELEIVRTHRKDFREALKERGKTLFDILERLKNLVK